MPPRHPPIGGPGSILPTPVESFLAWSICIACLGVSGYHYCVSTFVVPLVTRITNLFVTFRKSTDGGSLRLRCGEDDINANDSYASCWIPLTTHARSELDRCTPLERYHQLISMLRLHGLEVESECGEPITFNQKEKLVSILRNDTQCRRLASLAMRPTSIIQSRSRNTNNKININTNTNISSHAIGLKSTSLLDHEPRLNLVHSMQSIWSRLLELDFESGGGGHNNKEAFKFEISVVMPAYAETGDMLEKQILRLLNRCTDAANIEIIIVDAGGGEKKSELQGVVEKFKRQSKDIQNGTSVNNNDNTNGPAFGDIRLLKFQEGGGRGPCLNYGAAAAHGRILTFCHLDTALPSSWDTKVCSTLEIKCDSDSIRPNSCAFGFGIDTSPEGLSSCPSPSSSSSSSSKKNQPYYPPGIKAVETTANIRTQLYSLPYGDQTISIAKQVFDFLGGFPDQCLMEDYELVALLRKRASLLKTQPREALKIIDGPPALCSPRRWQSFGVLYVTFMNSKLVNLYSGGLGPDELYTLYYGRRPPNRQNVLSPWEVAMAE